MENDLPPAQLEAIKNALVAGRKIEAITIYRTSTGSDLVNAKAAVEKLEQQLRNTEGPQFGAPDKRGCLGVFLLFILLALTLLVLGR